MGSPVRLSKYTFMHISPICEFATDTGMDTWTCFVDVSPFVYSMGILIFILTVGLILWRR